MLTMGITSEIEIITPEQAQMILDEHNDHNRLIRDGKVSAYADDMRNGRWQFNGDPIRFDAEGTLLDGQHRLTAVVDSGIAQKFLVIRGLPRSAQDTMDQPAARSLADTLTLEGEANAQTCASVTNVDARWNIKGPGSAFTNYQQDSLTRPVVLDWWRSHKEEIVEASLNGKNYARSCGNLLSCTAFGVMWLNLHRIYPEGADDFFHSLTAGSNLPDGDPVLVLRNTLFRLKGSVSAKNKVTTRYKTAITVKAWNKYLAGEKISVLKWSPGGVRKEPFPNIAIPDIDIVE